MACFKIRFKAAPLLNDTVRPDEPALPIRTGLFWYCPPAK